MIPGQPPHFHRRVIVLLGSLTFLTWAILAVVFARERVIFLDTAFYLFNILKDGAFYLPIQRYGAVLVQILPWVCQELQLSLATIVIAFSLSFILVQALFFFSAVRWFGRPFAWAILMANILPVSVVFFWPISELQVGYSFLLWVFGLGFALGPRFPKTLLIIPLLFGSHFFHPLLIIPGGFMLLFFLLHQWPNPSQRKFTRILVGLYVITYGMRWSLGFPKMETGRMDVWHNLLVYFPRYDYLDSFSRTGGLLLYNHSLELILGLGLLLYYLWQKKWGKSAWCLFGFGGYAILIISAFPHGGDDFYMENLLWPLWTFIILPLAFDIVPKVGVRNVLLAFVLILAVKSIQIISYSKPFQQRLAWLENLVEKTAQNQDRKVIIDEQLVPKDTLMMTWGSAYESWLIGTMAIPENPPEVFIIYQPERYQNQLHQKDHFFAIWKKFPYAEMSPRYFHYSPGAEYKIIQEPYW